MKIPGFKKGETRVPKVGDWVLDYDRYGGGTLTSPKLRRVKEVPAHEKELRKQLEPLLGRIDKDPVQIYIPLGKHKRCPACRGAGYMLFADSFDKDNGKTCYRCKGWGLLTYHGKNLKTCKRKK